MFGLSLTSNSAINFFTHLKVHPDFEPVFMHFGSLIHLEPQVLQDTYMCTCNYIVLKSSVKPYLTFNRIWLLTFKHHQFTKLNRYIIRDVEVFHPLRNTILQVLPECKLGPDGRIG